MQSLSGKSEKSEADRRRPIPRWVPIRTLKPRHRRRILDHLVQLDEHDRYLRFGSPAPLEQLGRYTASIDFKRDEVFGVFDRRLRLVAVAHLAALPGTGKRPPAMEFGVSVLPSGRGRGLGQRLFEHAIMHARNHGARALVIHALTENRPMLRIALRAGAQLETDGADAEAWLSLPRDTLGSHLEGSLLAVSADLAFGIKRNVLRLKNWLASVRGSL
ncbi:MAG TPA: GNAT family N-acetyltransferase [Candidatus Aquabacterium excrementipullorum]|nr:GNAT family N-acetyltransferase [Candidatus Aquabacterium excrementipullorum]